MVSTARRAQFLPKQNPESMRTQGFPAASNSQYTKGDHVKQSSCHSQDDHRSISVCMVCHDFGKMSAALRRGAVAANGVVFLEQL